MFVLSPQMIDPLFEKLVHNSILTLPEHNHSKHPYSTPCNMQQEAMTTLTHLLGVDQFIRNIHL